MVVYRGLFYLFLDNYEDAKTNFIKCLELDHTDYTALYNVMYCFDFLEQELHLTTVNRLYLYLY